MLREAHRSARPHPRLKRHCGSLQALQKALGEDGSSQLYSRSSASPTEVVWLVRQADVALSGSLHVGMFSLLAGTPALLLEGITRKAEQLVTEVSSPAYAFQPVKQLLEDAKATATRLAALGAQHGDHGARAARLMPRLRSAAYSSFAPEGLADCMDMEVLLPSTAGLHTYWHHANFSAGLLGWMGWNRCT